MMFMMPMPPTSSEMPAMRSHHDVEDPLRPAALFEQRFRDDQLVVVRAAVQAVEERVDLLGGRAAGDARREAHDQLVERRLERIAIEFPHRRRDRDADLVLRRPDRRSPADPVAAASGARTPMTSSQSSLTLIRLPSAGP